MAKKLTIKDFTPRKIKGITVITWDELDMKMTGRERKLFSKWMFGQGSSMHGVFVHDLRKYLEKK